MPRDTEPPRGAMVSSFLASVARRVQFVDALRAMRMAAIVAAGGLLAVAAIGDRSRSAWGAVACVALGAAAMAAWRARPRWSGEAVASLVERRLPDSRNVIFTARELLSGPHGSAPWIERRVIDSAAAILGRSSPPAMVPLGRDLLWMAAALGLLTAIVVGLPQQWARAARTAIVATRPTESSGLTGPGIVVTMTPPSYTGLAPRRVSDPGALEVIKGSRIALAVTGAGTWSIRFGTRLLQATASGAAVQAELVPDESGYFAIERGGGETDRRLLPVTVIPDRAPAIKIDAPARDLLLPAARGAVPLAVVASDDFGLKAVELRYTKVSGSGEQFEFVEGLLPLTVTAESGKAWKAKGTFDLAGLGLEPGDSLVYRAVARDGRPDGTGVSASDTFFIEVAGPGQVAVPGFELPPDRERYALSQQMIVLKLQRLRARQAALSADALADELKTIEAEQRAVRANFIFLMGGHVEDEEEEAAQSNEIQEGRLENSARREINTAIGFMGLTERALAAGDTAAALPPARSAVEALQRAFGRNRYFMKTLAVRSRVDPARRLTGDLKEASEWRRTLEAPASDEKVGKARSILARLLDLLPGEGDPGGAAAPAIGGLAEEALAVDPGSPEWQRVSSALTHLRDALGGRGQAEIARAAGAAVAPLVALTSKGAVRTNEAGEPLGSLRSAWADEARKR